MNLATITAQQVLDENNYTTPTTTIVEYLIDNAIDYINLEAGLSINNMSGDTPGSKTVTVTSTQAPIIKMLSTLMIRAYKDRSSVGIGGLSVTAVISDPQYDLFTKVVERGIMRLRARSFLRT